MHRAKIPPTPLKLGAGEKPEEIEGDRRDGQIIEGIEQIVAVAYARAPAPGH